MLWLCWREIYVSSSVLYRCVSCEFMVNKTWIRGRLNVNLPGISQIVYSCGNRQPFFLDISYLKLPLLDTEAILKASVTLSSRIWLLSFQCIYYWSKHNCVPYCDYMTGMTAPCALIIRPDARKYFYVISGLNIVDWMALDGLGLLYEGLQALGFLVHISHVKNATP